MFPLNLTPIPLVWMLLINFIAFPVQTFAVTWTPKLVKMNRKLVVQLSPNSSSIFKISMEILESSNCETQILDSKTLTFSESCDLLHGVLKYQFTSENEGKLKKAYTEFLLTQSNPKNHAFLVNSPVIIDVE